MPPRRCVRLALTPSGRGRSFRVTSRQNVETLGEGVAMPVARVSAPVGREGVRLGRVSAVRLRLAIQDEKARQWLVTDQASSEHTYEPGALISEGERGDSIFVIGSGSVEACYRSAAHRRSRCRSCGAAKHSGDGFLRAAAALRDGPGPRGVRGPGGQGRGAPQARRYPSRDRAPAAAASQRASPEQERPASGVASQEQSKMPIAPRTSSSRRWGTSCATPSA